MGACNRLLGRLHKRPRDRGAGVKDGCLSWPLHLASLLLFCSRGPSRQLQRPAFLVQHVYIRRRCLGWISAVHEGELSLDVLAHCLAMRLAYCQSVHLSSICVGLFLDKDSERCDPFHCGTPFKHATFHCGQRCTTVRSLSLWLQMLRVDWRQALCVGRASQYGPLSLSWEHMLTLCSLPQSTLSRCSPFVRSTPAQSVRNIQNVKKMWKHTKRT